MCMVMEEGHFGISGIIETRQSNQDDSVHPMLPPDDELVNYDSGVNIVCRAMTWHDPQHFSDSNNVRIKAYSLDMPQ